MKRVLYGIFLALLLMIPAPQAAAQNEAIFKFEQFIQDYYKNPDPDQVPGLLLNLMDTQYFETGEVFKQNRQLLYAYAFGRIAEEEPSLVPLYIKMFDKASLPGKAFLVNVFQVCGNDEVKTFLEKVKEKEDNKDIKPLIEDALERNMPLPFDPLTKEIKIPYDIEMLWAEFFVSGNEEAIRRVLSLVDKPDIIREKILAYLNGDEVTGNKQLLLVRIRKVIGIAIDPETNEIPVTGDLGALMMSRIRQQIASNNDFELLMDQIDVPTEEFLTVATKAEAVRTLETYALRNDKVLKLCQQAIPDVEGLGKDFLLNLAFRGEFRRDNNGQARDYLMELIARNPDQLLLHAVLAEVYLALDDTEAAANQVDFLSRRDPAVAFQLKRMVELKRLDAWGDAAEADGEPIEDLTVLLSSIKAKSKSVSSYQTHVVMGDDKQTVLSWDADFVAPDRYSVEQGLYRDKGVLVDKWIAIGKDVYRFLGEWVHDGEGVSGLADISEKLRMDKWTSLLPDKSGIQATRLNIKGQEVVRLSFEPDFTEGFFARPISDEIKDQKATLWVNADNKYIRKAKLEINAVDPQGKTVKVVYDQEFFTHGADLIIDKPARVREMPKDQKSESGEGSENEGANVESSDEEAAQVAE